MTTKTDIPEIVTSVLLIFILQLTGFTGTTCFKEEIIVNPKTECLEHITENITYQSILKSKEICRYIPDNNGNTIFKQNQTYSLGISLPSFITNFSIQNLKANSIKGHDVMENLCTKLQHENF